LHKSEHTAKFTHRLVYTCGAIGIRSYKCDEIQKWCTYSEDETLSIPYRKAAKVGCIKGDGNIEA